MSNKENLEESFGIDEGFEVTRADINKTGKHEEVSID